MILLESSNTNKASDYIFKVVAIGDATVGKTALIQRYATNQFLDNYITTLGMNLGQSMLYLKVTQ